MLFNGLWAWNWFTKPQLNLLNLTNTYLITVVWRGKSVSLQLRFICFVTRTTVSLTVTSLLPFVIRAESFLKWCDHMVLLIWGRLEDWIQRDETSIPPARSMDQAFSEVWGINTVPYERFVITFIRNLLECNERDGKDRKEHKIQ